MTNGGWGSVKYKIDKDAYICHLSIDIRIWMLRCHGYHHSIQFYFMHSSFL